ncbi:MAG TPA: FadR/GntR family transcriptional regulator [Anaerolineales bacterium]|nr:FadR/GntR family transcriptional regulator [Anaerolineales bacterium]
MYTPIQSARLYEQIVEQIEARILAGDLKPGDKLPSERELAERFGVSRTAIREAVKALTQKGLIEVHPGRGTFVINSTPQAVRHSLDLMIKIDGIEGTRSLVEVREILEPEIAALAASQATEEHRSAMQEAVALMDASLDDIEAFIEADLDFHLALAEGTQNLLIPTLVDTLVVLLRKQRMRIALVDGGMARAQIHHKKILAAVRSGEPEAAKKAMRAHLQQIRADSESSLNI